MSDTLAWLPTNNVMPIPRSNNRATAATADTFAALNHPVPATALAPIHDNNRKPLEQLATIFSSHTAAQYVLILSPSSGFPLSPRVGTVLPIITLSPPPTTEGEYIAYEGSNGTTRYNSNTLSTTTEGGHDTSAREQTSRLST